MLCFICFYFFPQLRLLLIQPLIIHQGSDIIYATEYLKDLFKTVSILLSSAPGSIFLVSHMKRNPTLTFDAVYACAEENGFQWSSPEDGREEGMYTFYRNNCS